MIDFSNLQVYRILGLAEAATLLIFIFSTIRRYGKVLRNRYNKKIKLHIIIIIISYICLMIYGCSAVILRMLNNQPLSFDILFLDIGFFLGIVSLWLMHSVLYDELNRRF